MVKLYVNKESLDKSNPFVIWRGNDRLDSNLDYALICEVESWEKVYELETSSLVEAYKLKLKGVKVKTETLVAKEVITPASEIIKSIESIIKEEVATEVVSSEQVSESKQTLEDLSDDELRALVKSKGGKFHHKQSRETILEIAKNLGLE
jgi:hypothetical protein